MPIPAWVLDILACPVDHAPLHADPGPQDPVLLVCDACGRAYRVEDDVPVLLAEEAVDPGPGPSDQGPNDPTATAAEAP